jgi:hypothetical protein
MGTSSKENPAIRQQDVPGDTAAAEKKRPKNSRTPTVSLENDVSFR